MANDDQIFVSFTGRDLDTNEVKFGNAFFTYGQIGPIHNNLVIRDIEDRLEETRGLDLCDIVILYWRKME